MKKIFIYILPVLMLAGCSDWLDINDDPNNPTEVPNSLVLPAAEVSVATRLGGTLFNNAGFFAQYWTQAPEANQYNKIDNYDLNAPFLNRSYTELFAGALNDLEVIRRSSKESEEYGQYLVATVLRAYTYQMWVDMIDQVPYTEALLGSENKAPAYDDGDDIYAGLIAEVDEAISLFSAGSFDIPSTDLILNGDEAEWLGFANSMLLKLYMRASNAVDYSAEVQALIAENNFISADVTMDVWENQPNKHNPWYETNKVGLGTVNNIAALPIVSYFSQNSDPRLAVLFTDVSGAYVGGVPAMKQDLTDDYSHPIIGSTQPVYFYTMAEVELFKAEAYLRFNSDNASAQASYEMAIDYALAIHGLSGGSALYGAGGSYEFDGTIEQIAMQKWASLCFVNNLEGWCEARRLGYPAVSSETPQDIYGDPTIYTAGEFISPNGNALGFGNLIKRCPIPEESTRLNTNAPEQKGLAVPVWWDVNK